MKGLDLVEIGVFGKPHGIKGEIAAMPDEGRDVEAGSFVFAEIDGIPVPFRVKTVRTKGAGLLLTLKGIDTEAQAALLASKIILAESDKSDMSDPSDDDSEGFYLDDLTGFTIVAGSEVVGRIDDVDFSTENALFIVDRNGEEVLVPAAPELIDAIHAATRTVEMTLPDGLF